MRAICAGLLMSMTIASADAGERSAQLINSFQVMCTIEPLNFARTEEKAAAMRLPVSEDKRTPPGPTGFSVRSKSWILPLNSGPHELAATEGTGPKGAIKGCGIAAADADGSDFRAELTKTLKLRQPAAERTSPDGTLKTDFWSYGSGGLEIMFARRTDRPGVYLFLQTPIAK